MPTYSNLALKALDAAGTDGMTSEELAYEKYVNIPEPMKKHQNYSGVFATLRKERKIVQLKDIQRHDHAVYVLPQYVSGRPIVPYKSNCDRHEEKINALTDEVSTLRAQRAAVKALIKAGKPVPVTDLTTALDL